MEDFLAGLRASLKRKADLSGDGRVDHQDVALAMSQIEQRVAEVTTKKPIGALIVCTVVVAVVTFAITRAFC